MSSINRHKFKWRKRTRGDINTNVAYSSEISITGGNQALSDGVTINFSSQ